MSNGRGQTVRSLNRKGARIRNRERHLLLVLVQRRRRKREQVRLLDMGVGE